MTFRGEYDPTSGGSAYEVQDVVVIRNGPTAGTYVKVTSGATAPSDGSPDWVMLSHGDFMGVWA
jgi:hypothetical protein